MNLLQLLCVFAFITTIYGSCRVAFECPPGGSVHWVKYWNCSVSNPPTAFQIGDLTIVETQNGETTYATVYTSLDDPNVADYCIPRGTSSGCSGLKNSVGFGGFRTFAYSPELLPSAPSWTWYVCSIRDKYSIYSITDVTPVPPRNFSCIDPVNHVCSLGVNVSPTLLEGKVAKEMLKDIQLIK